MRNAATFCSRHAVEGVCEDISRHRRRQSLRTEFDRLRLADCIAGNIERAAVYFQEGPYITEWFTEDQVAYIRQAEAQVYEHIRDVIDRGIASGEFYDCDSHVLALGYIGMTLGSYRWLRPHGRRTAQEIAVEFSTALLRGLIRDEAVRADSPLGLDVGALPGEPDAAPAK